MSFDRVTMAETVATIADGLARGAGGWVVTPNLDILRQIVGDPEMRTMVAGADLTLADGMPIVWASRLAGDPLPERVAGSQLIWDLSGRCAADGYSVFLLGGGDDETCRLAAANLQTRWPGLQVAGWYAPPFGFERSGEEMDRIRAELRSARPNVVYCAFGFPKQERLIHALLPDLPGAWLVAVGGSVTMAAGRVERAPGLMQRTGTEWLHRLAKEPRRLFKRYVVQDLPFAAVMFAVTFKRAALGRWLRR